MEEKRRMVDTFWEQPPQNPETRVFRLIIPPSRMSNVQDWNSHDFITENTIKFFERFDIPHIFLNKDPSEWKYDENYKEVQQTLAEL